MARFITKTVVMKPGNPNADRPPWEIYAGQFSEEDWRIFEAYVRSDEFQVLNLIKNFY